MLLHKDSIFNNTATKTDPEVGLEVNDQGASNSKTTNVNIVYSKRIRRRPTAVIASLQTFVIRRLPVEFDHDKFIINKFNQVVQLHVHSVLGRFQKGIHRWTFPHPVSKRPT